MNTKHAAIWIDHKEATVFFIDGETSETLHAHRHVEHPKRGDGKHDAMEESYFHAVLHEVRESEEILVLGPATAKLQLVRHAHKHDHVIADKIVGVETVDHPTDGQILKYAKQYFHAKDRLEGTTP
jgi:stalled ribosome rescue protein Dom34